MKNELLRIYKKIYKNNNLDSGLNFIRHLDGELVYASVEFCKLLGYSSFFELDCTHFTDLLEQCSNYGAVEF
ncbi:MAG: hypothetical protein ACK5Z5_06925 [Neisseriaceae bacterium]